MKVERVELHDRETSSGRAEDIGVHGVADVQRAGRIRRQPIEGGSEDRRIGLGGPDRTRIDDRRHLRQRPTGFLLADPEPAALIDRRTVVVRHDGGGERRRNPMKRVDVVVERVVPDLVDGCAIAAGLVAGLDGGIERCAGQPEGAKPAPVVRQPDVKVGLLDRLRREQLGDPPHALVVRIGRQTRRSTSTPRPRSPPDHEWVGDHEDPTHVEHDGVVNRLHNLESMCSIVFP